MGKNEPTSSEQVRRLLDQLLATAPQTARSLVAESTRAVIGGLQRPRLSREWLATPAGMVAVSGGLSLLGVGWVLGRRVRLSRRTGMWLTAAAAAGFAAGLAVRARAAQAPAD